MMFHEAFHIARTRRKQVIYRPRSSFKYIFNSEDKCFQLISKMSGRIIDSIPLDGFKSWVPAEYKQSNDWVAE